MPLLTPKQMTLVRTIAAEVARDVVNKTIDPSLPGTRTGAADDLSVELSAGIVKDIERVAMQTAHKAIGQVVTHNRAAEELRQQESRMHRTGMNMLRPVIFESNPNGPTLWDCKCRFPGFPMQLTTPRGLTGFHLRPINGSEATANDYVLNVKHKPLEYFRIANAPFLDGDVYFGSDGEKFTLFMGEFRRREALEGFAAAKQYL